MDVHLTSLGEESWALVHNCTASVKKLKESGERFLEWKSLVEDILKCVGLWDVVDPDQNVNSLGNEDRNRVAKAIIQESVSFHINSKFRIPRDCWVYLQNKFAPNTPARRFKYMRRLWHLQMEEVETVEEFFSRVQDVLNHLHDMRVFIEQELLVRILINALPSSWDTIASRFWQECDTLTVDELYWRMTVEESRNGAHREPHRRRQVRSVITQ